MARGGSIPLATTHLFVKRQRRSLNRGFKSEKGQVPQQLMARIVWIWKDLKTHGVSRNYRYIADVFNINAEILLHWPAIWNLGKPGSPFFATSVSLKCHSIGAKKADRHDDRTFFGFWNPIRKEEQQGLSSSGRCFATFIITMFATRSVTNCNMLC